METGNRTGNRKHNQDWSLNQNRDWSGDRNQDQTGKGVGAGSRSENERVGAEVTRDRKGTGSRRGTGSGRKNKVRGLSPDNPSPSLDQSFHALSLISKTENASLSIWPQ